MTGLRIPLDAVLALAGASAAVHVLAWLSLRRALAAPCGPDPERWPSVTAVIPFKGALSPGALESFLAQDYPGRWDLVFVVASAADPALGTLREAASSAPGRITVKVSGAEPSRTTEMILNLLAGLDAAPQADLIVFAPSDMRVPPGWLTSLARPLARGEADLATTVQVHEAPAGGPGSALAAVTMAAGLPYYCLTPAPSGHSLMFRRAEFERSGLRDVWSRSLVEDLSLAGTGLRLAYVPAASPLADADGDGGVGVLAKWLFYARIYTPWRWTMAFVSSSLRSWTLFWLARDPSRWPWLAAAAGAEVLYAAAVLALLRGGLPNAPRLPAYAALLAPLAPFVVAAAALKSLVVRHVSWGGYVYEVSGRREVRVLR